MKPLHSLFSVILVISTISSFSVLALASKNLVADPSPREVTVTLRITDWESNEGYDITKTAIFQDLDEQIDVALISPFEFNIPAIDNFTNQGSSFGFATCTQIYRGKFNHGVSVESGVVLYGNNSLCRYDGRLEGNSRDIMVIEVHSVEFFTDPVNPNLERARIYEVGWINFEAVN